MKHTHLFLILPICALLSSCADEDMALIGAVATGAAANYAGANGDATTAASLLNTQQQIINEQANTAAANASSEASPTNYVTANPVPGKPGYAISPHSGKAVDVQGIAAGTLVEDPTYQNGRFRVPQSSSASVPSAPAHAASGSIVGTWSNASATWNLKSNGEGTVTIPSTNQNGTATTYLTWKANASSGAFAYTITRATLTGSLNCDGTYDYDKPVNKSYSEIYQLSGDTLKIGAENLLRN